jgi:hypothetical protein
MHIRTNFQCNSTPPGMCRGNWKSPRSCVSAGSALWHCRTPSKKDNNYMVIYNNRMVLWENPTPPKTNTNRKNTSFKNSINFERTRKKCISNNQKTRPTNDSKRNSPRTTIPWRGMLTRSKPTTCADDKIYLPPFINPATLHPSQVELERTTKFGKSNAQKSFMVGQKGALAQVMLPILKSGLLDQFDIWNIQNINTCFKFFVKGCNQTRNVDFRILQHPNTAWQEININEDKVCPRMAAHHHRDTDIASLQRH